MTFAMGGAPAPGSDRIPVELFQILKDDAVESAALNMQYARRWLPAVKGFIIGPMLAAKCPYPLSIVHLGMR